MISGQNKSQNFLPRMIGKLLGDGSITIQPGRKPRFQYIHRKEDYGWSNYCYHCLKSDIPLNAPKYRIIMDDRLLKGFSESYYVLSRTDDAITYLEKLWYKNRKKVIPFKLLNTFFNNESLAWWYQDDGHLKIERQQPTKIVLSTESFTQSINLKLIDFLYTKYKLRFRLDKMNRLVIYNIQEIYYFLHLVNPYIQSAMSRKTTNMNYLINKSEISARRTSLYLPEVFTIPKPTEIINSQLKYLQVIIYEYKKGQFYNKSYKNYHMTNQKPKTKSYQIIITAKNLYNLEFLKKNTGLTYSELTTICFIKYTDK